MLMILILKNENINIIIPLQIQCQKHYKQTTYWLFTTQEQLLMASLISTKLGPQLWKWHLWNISRYEDPIVATDTLMRLDLSI